jgi:hypothetical protein
MSRIIYIFVVNFVIGIILALLVLKYLTSRNLIALKEAGFQSFKHSLISVGSGFVLGISIYFLQNPPTGHPVVIFNAFFQVLSVSIAEIIVCWSLIGSSIKSSIKNAGNTVSVVIAVIISSIFFGLYHYGHSHPFNTLQMVLFLSVIGLFTGVFFFISKDVYGTIIFHNFFGIKGVIGALDKADKLSGYREIQLPVIVTAFIGIAILIIMHHFILSVNTDRKTSDSR